MKKVAIVGVEGSGKTVLMAAMGDKYRTPDIHGLFLRPENRETFSYYTREVANLRAGQWPLATENQVHNLNWSLMWQKESSPQPKTLGRLAFLDFGGEIYRRAFGDRANGDTENEARERKNAVALLKSHVQTSDVLIVLVNLSDIINGEARDERTIEMNWLSQAILSFAFDKGRKRDVALVLTQSDTYAETIARCGGARGTLKRYLREVDSSYGNRLALFTVAAVNKTVPGPDGSGLPIPAADFEPEGLEDLLTWMARRIVKQRRWRGYLLSAIAAALLFGVFAVTSAVYRYNSNVRNWADWHLLRPWVPEMHNPDNPKLVADQKRGVWKSTEEGYVWVGGSRTEWRAGIRSVEHPHWVSISTDEHPVGYWSPEPGYSKKDTTAEGLSELVWTPGTMDGARKAAIIEGHWLKRCDNCLFGEIKKKCDRCSGQGKRPCDNSNSILVVNPLHRQYGTYGKHMVMCGYCRGLGCMYCNGFGYWLRVPCKDCDGTGHVNCDLCDGSGTITGVCGYCHGDGWALD